MAMVMGPTPPGTGVAADILEEILSQWASPTSLYPFSVSFNNLVTFAVLSNAQPLYVLG